MLRVRTSSSASLLAQVRHSCERVAVKSEVGAADGMQFAPPILYGAASPRLEFPAEVVRRRDPSPAPSSIYTTQPRLKILAILESSSVRHVSAEDVYKLLLEQNEEIGLATVYRVLTQFEASGLVIRHNFEGGRSVFELNDADHHDHIVCVKCGKVVEFSDLDIEKRQQKAAQDAGFILQDHALYLYGVCHKCAKQTSLS